MTRIGVASPAEVKMIVDPTPVTSKSGTTFTVAIKVMNAPDGYWGVFSWQARLEWNNAIIKNISFTEGPFLKDWATEHSTTTWMYITYMPYGVVSCPDHPGLYYATLSCGLWAGGTLTNGRGGSGHLAYATFQVVGTGTSPLLFHGPGAATGAKTAMLNKDARYIGETGTGNTFTAVDGSYVAPRLGDVVFDGDVDILDLTTVAINYLKTGTPGWIPADVNKDGKIDIEDLASVAYDFGWYAAGTKPIDC